MRRFRLPLRLSNETRRLVGLLLVMGTFVLVHFTPFWAGLPPLLVGFALYVSTLRLEP